VEMYISYFSTAHLSNIIQHIKHINLSTLK
jgi:hypothetical protein